VSLINRLRGNIPQPASPPAEDLGEDLTDEVRELTEVNDLLNRDLRRLRLELNGATQAVNVAQRRAVEAHDRALAAERQLAALSLGPARAGVELARALETLRRYEDLLEGCRVAHGSNVAASSLPAVTR
jgi:hypothetical protein